MMLFSQQEPTVSKKKRQVVDLDADDSEEENSEDKAMKEQALSWPENLKKRKKEEEKEKKESGKAVDSKHNLFPFEKDHQLSSSAKLWTQQQTSCPANDTAQPKL